MKWHESPLRKFALLHVPILCCLFILSDNASRPEVSPRHHLAVFTALSRHPPSMRVFRGLFVVCLLGFCSSAILHVLEVTFGKEMVYKLFFSVPHTITQSDHDTDGYELTNIDDELQTSSHSLSEEDEELPHDDNDDENRSELKEVPLHESSQGVERDIQYLKTSPWFIACHLSLDLLLQIMVALFLFTISSSAGGRYTDQMTNSENEIFSKIGEIAAPIFPLLLFFYCATKIFFPWNQRRKYFLMIVSYTLSAPMYEVSFRDGFIGDIFTSMVRPMQDVAFTSFYLMSGLQGWWIYRGNTSEESILAPVEKSWLLHTIILPACTVSPLWWRFCQCLRQCFDEKKRWPYLGNAAKYFIGAQVAMFGVFDPESTGSFFWIIAFVVATLYQLWWDTFMDWELLEWTPSLKPVTLVEKICGGSFQLRKRRLYKGKGLYLFIFTVNSILRFGWTMLVMPTRYLSSTGVLLDTFSADFPTMIAPVLACAEVVRRSLWGLIRVELEVIKIKRKENITMHFRKQGSFEENRSDMEMEAMNVESAWGGTVGDVFPIGSNIGSQTNILFQKDMSSANEVQVLWELCLYAAIFTAMGLLAAVHRQVL